MDALCEKLLQVTKDGIFQYTFDRGKILYVNKELLSLFNIACNPDSLKGKSIKTVIPNASVYSQIKKQLSKKKEIYGFEYYVKKQNNENKWLSLNAHIIDDPSLKEKTIIAIVKDITKQKKIEKENEQLKNLFQSEKKGLLKIAKEIEEELSKSEQKYRRLVERAVAGVVTINLKGRFTYVNNALCKMMGFSKEELIGNPIIDLIHPDDKKRLMKISLEAFKHPRKQVELDFRGIHKNGHELYMHSVPTAYIYKGKILGFNAIITNITERKKAEEELRKERDRAQRYLDIAEVIVVAINTEGIVTLINRKGCEVLGFKEEEIVGKNWFDNFIPRRLVDKVKPASEMLLSGKVKAAEYFENQILNKQGEERLVAWHNTILRDEKGSIIGHLSSGEDITEQRKAEEEIRKSKELLEKSFASLDSAVFILDSKDAPTIIDCNTAATKIFGYEKHEMIGRTTAFLHVNKNALLELQEKLYATIKKQGYLSSFEFEMKRKNEQIFSTEHSIFPLADEKGNRTGWVSVVKDISERKKDQDALQESQKRYYSLFEYSPIPLWEEDFSEVKEYIDKLKKRGINDFRRYLEKHPEIVRECTALVKILDTNKATLDKYHAINKKHIISDLRNIFTDETYKTFIEEIIAVAQGKSFIQFQSSTRTLIGDKVDRIVRWAVLPGYEDTYSRLLVSEVDITEQEKILKELEESHEQLRTLSSHLEYGREEERKRISREIHDELGQALTALKMDISWLNKKIYPEQKTVSEKIETMFNLINETIQKVKKISSYLRPSIIDDFGLPAAIEWEADEFQQRTGIFCVINFGPEDIIIGTNISITLYRILQEALTNIARHAKATKVKITLKKEIDKLIFIIHDNGTGIADEKINDPKSFGLLGIKERVYHLGGNVKINGKPGRGTMVRVSVPVS